MPTSQDIINYYEANSYDIACFPDQISFLIRSNVGHQNLPLAVMTEMASQRLARESISALVGGWADGRKFSIHRTAAQDQVKWVRGTE